MSTLRVRHLSWANPAVVYAAIWIGGCALSYIPTAFFISPNPTVIFCIGITIVTFFIWDRVLGAYSSARPLSATTEAELEDLSRFCQFLFRAWIIGFVINVIGSRGLPLFWALTGDGRTYADFGLPSFSGLLVAVKLFLITSMVLLRRTWSPLRILIVVTALFGTTFLELNRGGLTLMGLSVLGVVLTLRLIPRWFWIFTPVAALGAILAFGKLAELRGVPYHVFESLAGKGSFFLKLPSGFFWVFTYWTSPIQNLYFAADTSMPLYAPVFTLQSLIPSVIRESLIGLEYPIPLINPALNATSFLGPLLADFGLFLSTAIIALLQAIFVFAYRKSQEGAIPFVLINAMSLAAILLSVFYMFFLSLPVLFFVFLVVVFKVRNFVSLYPRKAVAV